MAILNRMHGFRTRWRSSVCGVGLGIVQAVSSGRAVGWLAAGLMAACSPALNWRLTDLEGPGQALFPCRPEHRSREGVPIGESRYALRQSACEAQGMTFAVTTIRLDTADGRSLDVGRLMDELERTMVRNIEATQPAPAPDAAPAAVAAPGGLRRLRLQGRRAEGEAVVVDLVLLQRAGWVLQAAVVASSPNDDAAQVFFDGLQGRL